jgi:hypothetical protein
MHPLTQPSLPQGGEGLNTLSPLPVGEGWVRACLAFLKKEPPTLAAPVIPPEGAVARRAEGGIVVFSSVFPAKAGTQTLTHRGEKRPGWIPAFAGNTAERVRA